MADKIVPRWEWRTFGEDFPEEEKMIQSYGIPTPRKSEEAYILSKNSDENTKIRDGLMDIKSLQAVNDNKLEQWKPIMKESFPLNVEALGRLFQVFRVPAPEFQRTEYSYDEFLNELVKPNDLLRLVDVRKERFGYTINDCTVEFARTEFNGVPLKTFCVEHADPDLVYRTVQELGLAKFPNINYIKAMKKTVGI